MKGMLTVSVFALLLGCAGQPQSKPEPKPQEPKASQQLQKEAQQEPGGENSRQVGSKKLRARGGATQADAIKSGLAWLAKHQSAEGRWRSDGFDQRCPPDDKCGGKGLASNDIGVTGLALLAFLGDGNTHRTGPYKAIVEKAASWLVAQQGDSGLIGQPGTLTSAYNHAIATMALAELSGLGGSKVLRPTVQKAVDYIQKARNPYKVWRYHPRDGDNDSSVTGWMVSALTSAKSFGYKVDKKAFAYSLAWYSEVTDPNTGQVGYTKLGEGSSRPAGMAARFPATKTEALTALGLCCRIFMGQTPEKEPILRASADRLLEKVPVWTDDGSIDFFYWYFGSLATYQMGRKWWKGWKKGMEQALTQHQVQKRHAKGSWDPVGVWGSQGGRVGTTALAVMCLQVYYRYTKLIR